MALYPSPNKPRSIEIQWQASVIRRNSFMARRDESFLNLLAKCPWWVSILVSGMAFVFLKFILPSINFHNAFINGVFKELSGVALFVALILLIPAPIPSSTPRVRRDFSIPRGISRPFGK
jgi:hypothetical protein